MTSPPVKQIDTTVTKETKQMPAVNDSTHEKSIDTKVEEDNDSNSGWGCIDDNDDKKEEKIENTNWDTKATVWNTEEKKVNDTCTTNSQAQEEDKESGWGAVDDVNEKKGNWDAKDDNKDNAEDNGRWNSFGSSKPARQFSQRNDQGWGRGGNDHSRGYQSGSERGSQRFGRNDQERSNPDSFDRNRRGGRDSYQRRDDNGSNDGYGRGGFRSNDGYKRDNYGSNDSFRRGGQRGDDNYRQDNYGRNDYNQRGHDDMQSSRGGYYDQQRGFEPRNKQYNQRENDSMNNSSMYPRNDFGQQDGFTKRKTYYDQDKRPRQEFYNESYGNQSPSYQSGYNPPRRDFPDNEATRRFKKPRPINPPPSKVIGIFGMPISSAEPDIEKFILDNCPNAKFNDIRLVKNHATGLSKGFCFFISIPLMNLLKLRKV